MHAEASGQLFRGSLLSLHCGTQGLNLGLQFCPQSHLPGPKSGIHIEFSFCLAGIKGQVFDKSRNPLPNVIVEVQDRKHICPFRTNKLGEYYLLLLPGSYVINVSVRGQLLWEHGVHTAHLGRPRVGGNLTVGSGRQKEESASDLRWERSREW